MRQLLPILCLIALSGCATSLHRLDDLKPAATDFPSSLAAEYKDYADSEYEQGHLLNAHHFAGKGLDALAGKPVEPEPVADASRQDLADGRAQLVKFLSDAMKAAAPQKLAHAQLLFDCWQNELLKHINQEKAPCEEEFHSTMAELQEASDALNFGRQSDHIVTFASGSASLDEPALATVNEVAKTVEGMPRYRVRLLSYVGHGQSQRRLSDRRLAAVRHALVKAGVEDKHIRVKKEGGAQAVVLSRDHIVADAKKITILVKTQR